MDSFPQELFRIGGSHISDWVSRLAKIDYLDLFAATEAFCSENDGFKVYEFFNQDVNGTTWDRATVVRNEDKSQIVVFCVSENGSAAIYADHQNDYLFVLDGILSPKTEEVDDAR